MITHLEITVDMLLQDDRREGPERFTELDGALRSMADTVGELSNNVLRLLPRVGVLEEQHRTLQDISAFTRVAVAILKFIAGAVVVGAAVVAYFAQEG